MGNSQSTEASRRRSHRLSKPKTNNHATAGLLSPSGLSNTFSNNKTPQRIDSARMSAALPPPPSPATATSSVVYSSAPDAMWEVEQGFERTASMVSTTTENESKRRSLFRSKSSQVPSKSERRNSLGPASRLIDKIGRTNSLTYESAISHYGPPNPDIWSGAPKARSSWNYDLSSYEAKRLLNLVEEPTTDHGPALSEHNVTVVSESTWKSSNPAQPASTPISRANSDVSLYMPVRRRSIIQKPGIATRSNSVREGFSQSRPTFRYSHPPTPSLSRQQSIESYRSGVMSMPPQRVDIDSMPRVSTPCEEKYQSIGGFKLGSLRITNGAASPGSPEVEKNDQIGGRRDDNDGKDHLRVPSQQGIMASNALQIIMQNSEDPFRIDSPSAGENSTVVALDEPQFLGQIDFSPFSLDEDMKLPSPQLQTTSKATAQEDELFEEETQVEYSSVEVLDVRLDPNAKSDHGPASGNDKMASVERKDSGFVSISSPLTTASHKPLTKADSGYSSNVSLRSFQSKSQVVESPEGPVSTQPGLAPVAALKSPSKIAPQREWVLDPQREASPPPVPPKDYPKSPTQAKPVDDPVKSQFLSAPSAFRSSKKSPVPLRNLTNSLSGPNSPESVPLTPASAKSAKSDKSASTLSIGSGSYKPNRFQKLLNSARRPSSGPLTVHTTHVVEKTGIPSIPQDVEHKLHEHTGMFPITTKRLALKPRTSMDTLKTIFSVGSMEASLEAVNRLSGVGVEVEEPSVSKEAQWRHTLQSVPSQIAHAAAHVIPRKPIARKSLDPRHQGPGPEANHVSRETTHIAYSYTSATEIHSSSERGVSSPGNPDRMMSMRFSMERSLDVEVVTSGPSMPNLSASLPSPALPSPLLARPLENKPRTGPPVSMTTRRPGSLRVPPPLRSQSSASSLSRRASKESLYSRSSGHSASRENMHSTFSSYQQQGSAASSSDMPPPVPTMDPRRLNAFRQSQPPSASWARVPNWDIQTDHDTSRQAALASLEGSSRHNSLSSSNPGQAAGFTIQRSASAQGWKVQTNNNPPLRHRSSYDSLQYRQPPSMSNGYTAPHPPSKPMIQSSEHFDFVNNQWVPDGGRYPPPPQHVPPPRTPKHHQRKRSMSAYGHQAPYRILHSYNSPAYRNVPIWG
ncbi:hypothetical protein QBC37DRAFT_160508 [Rhypophila decipiens]|uniref:Uncharacterized protein n=1 Tax=Rhypophila decipiens TaxID=261697 RepID=A0AAN6Y7I7_9PEZI|nr:hypothetical protein QBC37DRAFT_160508 [Rhypophila decipiens]